MIKAILFDMGNVLVSFDARKSCRVFSQAFGVAEEALWNAFFVSGIEKSYTRGEISSEEFVRRASEHLPAKKISFETFARIWNDIFTENREMEDFLKKLKRRYPLYLISNTNELHFEYVKSKFHVLNYFTKCFPSHLVGHRKPDAAIFKHVLHEIQLKPEETVFVDDVAEFVEGAKRLGIHGIQFTSRPALESDLRKLGVKF